MKTGLLQTLGTAAAVTLALAVADVQAAPVTDDTGAPAVRVRYDDLNLASADGTRTLYKRIVAAAQEVCPQADERDLPQFQASRACQKQAIERAVREVHDAHLAALREQLAKG